MSDEVVAPQTESVATDAYSEALVLLKKNVEEFIAEAQKGYTNKAAAGRARKMSLNLRKNLQEWREMSIANDKKAKQA